MCRTAFALAALAMALTWPTAGRANQVILLTDPQSSTPAITLLEHALVQTLREAGHEVMNLERPMGKQGRAQRMLDQAESLRQTARDQFEQLELDMALKKYTKALSKLNKSVALTDDLRPLTDTLTMLAATYLLLGQERRARGVLEQLLVLDPAAAPNEAVFNPQMMAVFEAVASRVRGSPSFDVEVTVDPPGTAVLFDGKLVGVAPVTVADIHRGRHYVTASLKGFETAGRAVDIKARSGHAISMRLTETRGDSRIQMKSSLAVSAIDDPDLPPEASELAAGVSADTVLLLAVTGSTFKLVQFVGGDRSARTAPKDVRNVGSARRIAAALLGPLAAGSPSTGEVIAASTIDDGYSDDFSDGGDPDSPPPDDFDDPPPPEDDGRTALIDPDEDESSGGGLLSANATKDTALWATYGTAVGLAGIGGVFGVLALSSKSEYDLNTKDADGKIIHAETTDQQEGVPLKEAGERNALIADVLYGAGIAALITGICMHIFWDAGGEPATSVEPKGKEGGEGWGWMIGPGMLRIDF